ncbi:MAG: aspartate 1-decarboxylase [Planctomycetota bacterium]|jgi:aspartate 1-decarboxylase
MRIEVLKSKIHRARITGADLDYEGSLALDPDLMKAAHLVPYEKVAVANINSGSRFETYVIPAEPGSGTVLLNGAAARLGTAGDLVIIFSYVQMDEEEIRTHRPAIVQVDRDNRVLSPTR